VRVVPFPVDDGRNVFREGFNGSARRIPVPILNNRNASSGDAFSGYFQNYHLGYGTKLFCACGQRKGHEQPYQVTLAAGAGLAQNAFDLLAYGSDGDPPQARNLI
jgi:hypothetical protein